MEEMSYKLETVLKALSAWIFCWEGLDGAQGVVNDTIM